ncbi:hypothetical protein [Clostridium sp. KNHs214]|uniref:hypothetical protein n=1 Tax=Clostridium sp. KNHs214 TaxID=1540257 RepID=UPI000ADAE349|nr:hypothetical protein [Clostridium sp. KNHs214]
MNKENTNIENTNIVLNCDFIAAKVQLVIVNKKTTNRQAINKAFSGDWRLEINNW